MSIPLTQPVDGNGDRSLLPIRFPIPPIIFNPWPWPSPTIPIVEERSVPGESPVSGDLLEVLEAICPRPDVRQVIATHAKALAELIGEDEEAARELRDLVQETVPGSGEREPVTLGIVAFWACCVAVGAGLGYLSRAKS